MATQINNYNSLTGEKLQQGQSYVNAQGNTVTQGTVLTPQQLQPATAIKTVPPPVDNTNYAGMIGSVSEQLAGSLAGVQNDVAKQEKLTQNQGTDLASLLLQQGNQPLDLANAEANQGVSDLTKKTNEYYQQLQNLNAQAMGLNREAQAIPLQVQEANRNTGATDRGVAPQEAGALRLNALKALSIAQQADIANAAYTGSQNALNSAKEKAKQIVDIKYAQIEAQLKAKQLQYELNKDTLDRLDKKRSEALQIALKKEEQQIADAKELEKYKTETVVTAQAAGAPVNVIEAAKNAKSSLEVAQILGKYSPETLKYELLKEQIKTEKAQRANIYANIEKTKTETSQLGLPGSGKPPTEGQIASAGYADRIQQANSIIDAKTPVLQNLNYAQFKLLESKSQLSNKLLTPDQRQAAQAMRNFITAKLRKESGAAISPTEFEDARLQYFPALGDDSVTIQQKKALRDSVLNNLITGSGSAYQPTAVNNLFSQAIGGSETFSGTSILKGTNNDGTLNFNIPSK